MSEQSSPPPWSEICPKGRPVFRIWDNENGRWYEPTYEAWQGRLKELLIMPSGDLCLRDTHSMTHESIFPGRFEVVHVGWT